VCRLQSSASSTVYCLVQSQHTGCRPEPVQLHTFWYSHSIQAEFPSQFKFILFGTVTVCSCSPQPVQTDYCLVESLCVGWSFQPVQLYTIGTVTAYRQQSSASSTSYCLVQSLCVGCSLQPVQPYTAWYSHIIRAVVLSQFNLILFGTVTVCRLQSSASSNLYSLVHSMSVGCSLQPVQPYTLWYSHIIQAVVLSQFNLIVFGTITVFRLQPSASSTL